MVDLRMQWNYEQLSKSARIASGITLLVAEILGITGNLFVVIIITRILKHRQNIPNILICILSITDLIGLPLTYSQAIFSHIVGRYLGGPVACSYHGTAIIMFKYMSIISIALISLDRFIAMAYPFCYKERLSYDETRKFKIAIVLILIVAITILLSILPLMGVGQNVLQYPNSYCLFDMDYKKEASLILLSIHITFLGTITLVVIVSNIGVCIQAHLLIAKIRPSLQMSKREVEKKRLSELPSKKGGGLKRLTPKQEKKLLRISIISIGVFVICWLPFLLKMCLAAGGVKFSKTLDFAAARLVSMHSVLTPWIYPLFRKQYSAGFWYLFRLFVSKITLNLVKKPDTELDDIVGARFQRREALQFYLQRNRTQSKKEATAASNEIELQGEEHLEISTTEQLKTNQETSVTFLEEENANDENRPIESKRE